MSTFKLPDLGEGLAEAEILEWHVALGDRVVVDQPMVSVETAKAVVEVPAPYGGTVAALHGAVGDIIATGAPLIDFDSGTVVGAMPATSEKEFVESAIVGGSRPSGPRRARAVPVARALARQWGLDLAVLKGSGTGGIITLDDVVRHAPPGAARSAPHPTTPFVTPPPGTERIPLRGARRAMSHSMAASRDQIAGSTVFDDADIHAWTERGDYMLRLIRAIIAACTVEPSLNAWYDPGNDARVLLPHIDLGIAVDTPGGLIVPVLRDIRTRTADALRTAVQAQKEAAHGRRITPDDLRDCTLMLSNFGTLAGRYGIPLVVPPAVGILAAGRVRTDAVAVGEAVVAHRRMPLSLSFDHRCVTGGEACRFLAAAIADLEKPT